MPNCFQLTRKSNPEAGPVPLVAIDSEMCEHFHAPCHPTKWFHHWYDYIGFALACGKDWNYIRKNINEQDLIMLKIIDWLEANFTSDSWYQVGK